MNNNTTNGNGNHLYHSLRHFPNVRIGIVAANELHTNKTTATKKNNYYDTTYRLSLIHI